MVSPCQSSREIKGWGRKLFCLQTCMIKMSILIPSVEIQVQSIKSTFDILLQHPLSLFNHDHDEHRYEIVFVFWFGYSNRSPLPLYLWRLAPKFSIPSSCLSLKYFQTRRRECWTGRTSQRRSRGYGGRTGTTISPGTAKKTTTVRPSGPSSLTKSSSIKLIQIMTKNKLLTLLKLWNHSEVNIVFLW